MKQLWRIGAFALAALYGVAHATGKEAICEQERQQRKAGGVEGEGPICLATKDPNSALSRAASFSEDDLLGCGVILCMSAPGGADSIEECRPTMQKYKKLLKRGKKPPDCPLIWADKKGGGGTSHTVSSEGKVTTVEDKSTSGDRKSVTQATDTQVSKVAEVSRQAYNAYGIACNSVDRMIEQMGESEGVPRGGANYDWLQRGVVTTAYASYDAQPDWWKSSNARYSEPWGRILPWFVAFEGEGNRTGNATVQIGRMAIQYLSISQRKWIVIDRDKPFAVSGCQQGSNYYNCPDLSVQSGPDGYGTFTVGNGINGHGWFDMLTLPDPADVQAITVSIEARLVGANADSADVLMDTGADWYPTQGTVPSVLPGAGESRLERLSSQWQTISMVTLSDLIRGSGRGISIAELRANPPSCGQ